MNKKNNKIFGFLFAIASLCIIGYGIYIGLNIYSEYKKKEIRANLGFVIGELVSKHSYKGKDFSIRYKVKNEVYITRIGVSTEYYEKYVVGSQILIKYDTLAPKSIIIEE